MRRPRDTVNPTWEDRPPAQAAPPGSRQYNIRSTCPSPSADSDGGCAWLGANGRAPLNSKRGPAGRINEDYEGVRHTALDLMLRLIFWPITLTAILFKMMYFFLLHVGTSDSPLGFRDPSRCLVQTLSWPFRLANPPVVLGAEHLEDALLSQDLTIAQAGQATRRGDGATAGNRGVRRSPVLLVGNHTLLGLDCIAILDQVQARTGVYPRVIYDTLFSYFAGWRQIVELAGGVKGILGNGDALMSEGHCLMMFPGGAREALKPSAEKYKLMWSGRMGYVRMAIRYGYALIPFASVGMEDAVKVAFSIDVSWIARQLEKQDRGRLRVPFLYPYNSLERQYFAFGKAIDTSRYGGDWENTDKCSEVYTELQGVVERLIRRLKCVQQLDPDRFLLRRTWRWSKRICGLLVGGTESRTVEIPGAS